ncbi:mycofactocin-coupled SDR family oxidoreductase [Rhodococcus sp. NPDC057014]|uniref:mycofactocin-coupled SDR family oxidoreductase n=1 Tax=Rhodococcus sp. NPDC057014 TaxID=3346000 RepID=UPI0036335CA9
MTGRVEGKVAVVTGAARGQGRSHAIRLAEEGADIIAVDISENIEGLPYRTATAEELAETVESVEKLGRRVVSLDVDVRNLPKLTEEIDGAVAQLGRLDIVAANAGIGTPVARNHEFTEDEWKLVLDVDLTGVWHTTKVAVPHILAGGRGGAMVLTSSMAGLKGLPNLGTYTVAKHGVVGLMRSLASELARDNIRVNTLHPTTVPTPLIMNDRAAELFLPDVEKPTREQLAEVFSTLNAMPVPWIDPVDVSNALLFLASDEARYITGVTLPVDAGFMLV